MTKEFTNYQIFDYERKYNNMELIILSLLSISLPIFIGHPQIVIGSLVNLMLFRAALSMEMKKALPIIFLPSIGAYLGDLLFGEATSFLIFFIPIIWLGNAIYVFAGKFVSHKMDRNLGVSVIVASALKSSFLFISAVVAVNLFGFPVMFLTAMGIFQFITAMIGGFSAFFLTKAEGLLMMKG